MDQAICPRCGAHGSNASHSAESWECSLCGYQSRGSVDEAAALAEDAREALSRGEAGRAMQLVDEGLRLKPDEGDLIALKAQVESHLSALRRGDVVSTESPAALMEAENYHLQATFVLNEVQANIQVYGSNSMLTGATPANVDLGLQYIDRSLELFPDNPVYLNTKALLLSDGKGDKAAAKPLLERAAALAPRDINIQNNLKAISDSGCFIATAAFGTPFGEELHVLRGWRDRVLLQRRSGRAFVLAYYAVSPIIANAIRKNRFAKAVTRTLLRPLVAQLKRRIP